ncbi:MAG: hypothetical protein ACR5LD_08725 [Symbiopectobacterium sp.]
MSDFVRALMPRATVSAWLTYPEDAVCLELEAGTLTRVLEDWCAPFPSYCLYYPILSDTQVATHGICPVYRCDTLSG